MILMLQLSSGVSALSSGFTPQVTQHQLRILQNTTYGAYVVCDHQRATFHYFQPNACKLLIT